MIRVAARQLEAGKPPTLAVRVHSGDRAFLSAVESSALPPVGSDR